ncbi:MAG: hypothetical protein JWO38_3949 [Gemmataceae bacterium]|nr:hypothetical protein [Gemmataceae bacterium]
MLPPNTTTKVVVRMQPRSQNFAVGGIAEALFQSRVGARFLHAKVEQVLRDSLAIRRKIAAAEEKLEQLQAEREKIHAGRKRSRKNLGALGDRPSGTPPGPGSTP